VATPTNAMSDEAIDEPSDWTHGEGWSGTTTFIIDTDRRTVVDKLFHFIFRLLVLFSEDVQQSVLTVLPIDPEIYYTLIDQHRQNIEGEDCW
jgi:hypothetical protein